MGGQDGGLVPHFIRQAGMGVFKVGHHIDQGGFKLGHLFIYLFGLDGLADGRGFAPGTQKKGLADGNARGHRDTVQNARGHWFKFPR